MSVPEMQREQVAEVRDLLADVEHVTVTEDPPEALSVLASGGCAVIIPPPALSYITRHQWEAEWECWALAPTLDPAQCLSELGGVLKALASGGGEARPDIFEASHGRAHAGYLIRIRHTYQL